MDIDADVYEYIDETVQITPPGGQAGVDVNYYVKGLYMEIPPNPTETEPTNTVSINVRGKEIEKQFGKILNSKFPSYSLDQNYPNPFNPLTTIAYSVAENSIVTIKVYDMLGNELALLVNERKEHGSYKTTFDGSNLPSGVYLYKLAAGNFTSAKKFILLK